MVTNRVYVRWTVYLAVSYVFGCSAGAQKSLHCVSSFSVDIDTNFSSDFASPTSSVPQLRSSDSDDLKFLLIRWFSGWSGDVSWDSLTSPSSCSTKMYHSQIAFSTTMNSDVAKSRTDTKYNLNLKIEISSLISVISQHADRNLVFFSCLS